VSHPRVVIGLGNPLRQDDGMGWRAAELIEARLTNSDIEVSACHQLTPDLAAKMAEAPLVVFLDADVERAPGEVSQRAVAPEGRHVWSHHLTPGQLLSLVEEVYGHAPPSVLISGGVLETNVSEWMTATGELCAARMAEVAIDLLANNRREARDET
jgi:hydrogenase maturation protease